MKRKIKYYIVSIKYAGSNAYVTVTSDTHGDSNIKFRLTASRGGASTTQSVAAARRWAKAVADTLNMTTTVEELEAYTKNPSPSPAERSAKFRRLRAALLTKLSIASRKGSAAMKAEISRKLLKLDRMFYAPRNIKRRK